MVQGARDTVDTILDHPDYPGNQLRGFHPGGKIYVCPSNSQRQACAVPGWRKEPGGDHARCRHRDHHAYPGRQHLRLRRTALRGGLVGDHHWRSAARPSWRPSPKPRSAALSVIGLDEGVQMGPVISAASRERIEGLIARGIAEGATLHLDGRKPQSFRVTRTASSLNPPS